MWYRVFCRSAEGISPSAILEHLHERGLPATGHFKGDDLGWTSGEFLLGPGSPVMIERYLTKEDALRDDLNTWAAYVETLSYSPNAAAVMERVFQTQQMLTIRKPIDHSDEIVLNRLCETVCQQLCERADGLYQNEGEGWFSADGTLLIPEY
jgi:hypothetical protein